MHVQPASSTPSSYTSELELDRRQLMEAAGMVLQPAEPLKANITTCIPRLRTGGMRTRRPRRGGAPPAGPTSATTVIDRLRDALLRLAMLSAVTTSPTKGAGRLRQTTTMAVAAASVRMSPSSATYPDSYRSEAVDDCIEFFKRSAAGAAVAPACISPCAMGI